MQAPACTPALPGQRGGFYIRTHSGEGGVSGDKNWERGAKWLLCAVLPQY